MAKYPTEEELERIANWSPMKDGGWWLLMHYIKKRWKYADCGYWKELKEGVYNISTGGWSGNEDIIGAMTSNKAFWLNCWHESRRGGHYKFEVR